MSKLSRAESWNRVYQASKYINFTSFDFPSVKQSLIDYFKIYHPEFNNWIETDELVQIIEAFAYVCEMISYRIDMIGNETFLTTAQRRDSILKLVKFISYKPSRTTPGIGLVKITSVSTTENIYDINGNNLANTKIIWNDRNNPDWKHQFFAIINHTIIQTFGDVSPNNRVQVYDQMFERYTFDNIPLTNGVITYSAQTQNKSLPMELVSCELNEFGPIEQIPNSNKFSFVYGTDGLGDTSNYTGFFILTKQGKLNLLKQEITNAYPHHSLEINTDNINDIDIWLNERIITEVIDSLTNKPIITEEVIGWDEVDTINAQNVIIADNTSFKRFEVETLDNDNIKIHFGDGVYAEIPKGTFEIWYRTSDPDAISIPALSVNNIKTNITYYDTYDTAQNLIFEFSLADDIQNAAPKEDLDHMRNNAPSMYYTQNRMVTAYDYNNFLLQDNSILKIFSINRTYAGHSKFTKLNDASDTYQDINHFGNDLSIYIDNDIDTIILPGSMHPVTLVINNIQPLLSLQSVQNYIALNDLVSRRYFTDNEIRDIVYGYMGEVYFLTDTNPRSASYPFAIYCTDKFEPNIVENDNWLVHVDLIDGQYYIKYKISKLIGHSKSTRFWTTDSDKITILNSNLGNQRFENNNKQIDKSVVMPIIGPKYYKESNKIGLIDNNSIELTVNDDNLDGLPDLIDLNLFIGNKFEYDIDVNDLFINKKYDRLFDHAFDQPFDSYEIDIPTIKFRYNIPVMDIKITGNINNTISFKEQDELVTDQITITEHSDNTKITIEISDYIYFRRDSKDDPFEIDNSAMFDWLIEERAKLHTYTTRKSGRSDLIYLWQHQSKTNTRINPSTSNIIDCFIITRGYYYSMMQWINGQIQHKPKAPTTNELMMAYNKMISHKMISDEFILRSGEFKILFGKYAPNDLKAKFVVVRGTNANLTDIQIKSMIIEAIYKFFDINIWNFGDTFNFTELSAYIHNTLKNNIESCILVPLDFSHKFGTLFQVFAMENEIFMPCIDVNDIEVVNELTISN